MAGSTLSVAPATEPVTVEEARSQCRIDSSTEDGLIAGYLLAARRYVEGETGRVLVTQTWIETFDSDWPRPDACGPRQIMLQRPPVQSVSGITYLDTNGAQQTLNANQYTVGRRQKIWVINEAYGVSWPAVRCQIDTIAVTYVAGYAAASGIPDDIRQAIMLLVAHFYKNREATTDASQRVTPQELPIGVSALLGIHVVPWGF